MIGLELNTKKYESVIKEVFIDDREHDRINLAEKLYQSFNPRVTRLRFCDYVFSDGTVKVGFEFKTANDFLSSIDDSVHLHNQVFDMVNFSEYSFCFVIVSGDVIKTTLEREKAINRSVLVNQINGVTSSVLLSCPILYVSNDLQAFDLMMRIAGKFIQDQPVKYKYHRKSYNSALNLLSSIHGLDEKANVIVDSLGLHTINDVLSLTKEDLVSVKSIGSGTADTILNEIQIRGWNI